MPKTSILEGKNLKEICNLMQLQKRVKEFDGAFKVENSKLVCVYCNEKLSYKHKQLLEKHVSSKKHLRKEKMLRAKLVRVIEDHESDSKSSTSDSEDSDDEWESKKKENKKRLTPEEKIQFRLKEFGSVLRQEGGELLCVYCNQKLKYNENLSIKRHLASKFHENKVSEKHFQEQGGERPVRRKNTTASAAQVEFNIELCKVFLVAGISLSKLSHPIVKKFFTKYTTMMIPVESTLRKSYWEPARLTLQAEAERLKQEMMNRRNKNPGARGRKSKKRKRNSDDDEEEDPLVFTEEQLESMLSLKVEPKEEPVEETERLQQDILNKKHKNPLAKVRKSKKRNRSSDDDDDNDDEENPLVFTEEQLESMLSLKVEPIEETERLQQDILNKKHNNPLANVRKPKRRKEDSDDDEEDPLAFRDEQLESILSLKVEPKEEPREELIEESVQNPLWVPRGELEDFLELKDEPLEPKVEP